MDEKVAHFYWGNSPMTWLRHMSVVTFRHLNPEWDVRLHTCPEHEALAWNTGQAIDQSRDDIGHDYREDLDVEWVSHDPCGATVNQMADLVRWRTLAEDGGVFFDMDIVFASPMDGFMDILATDAVMCRSGVFYIGVMSSASSSPFFRAVAEKAADTLTTGRYQSAGVEPLYLVAYGVNVVATDGWGQVIGRDGHAALAEAGFTVNAIPYGWLHYCEAELCLQQPGGPAEGILGYHWSGGSDAGARANRDLSPETLRDYTDSPLERLLRGHV